MFWIYGRSNNSHLLDGLGVEKISRRNKREEENAEFYKADFVSPEEITYRNLNKVL